MFKFITTKVIEYLLGDKYTDHFCEGFKWDSTLKMVDNNQSSSQVTPTSLSENLVTPEDKVVYEKNGWSITDTFLCNTRIKLLRGARICLDEHGYRSSVTFRQAIDAIRHHHPEHAFSWSDEEKMKILITEKGMLPVMTRLVVYGPNIRWKNVDKLFT